MWRINSLSKFSEKALKSSATKYFKFNEETHCGGTVPYHIVTEHSSTHLVRFQACGEEEILEPGVWQMRFQPLHTTVRSDRKSQAHSVTHTFHNSPNFDSVD
jgi:hypothetical protein